MELMGKSPRGAGGESRQTDVKQLGRADTKSLDQAISKPVLSFQILFQLCGEVLLCRFKLGLLLATERIPTDGTLNHINESDNKITE